MYGNEIGFTENLSAPWFQVYMRRRCIVEGTRIIQTAEVCRYSRPYGESSSSAFSRWSPPFLYTHFPVQSMLSPSASPSLLAGLMS